MLRIQLLADPAYIVSFSDWIAKIEGVQLVEENPDAILDLSFLNIEKKLARLQEVQVGSAVVITNTLTIAATTVQSVIGVNAQLAGAPIFPNYVNRQKLIEFMLPFGSNSDDSGIREVFGALGKESERVQDAIAGVFPRTLSMIINEAAFAVQEGIATATDIDTAMKLGTNYPTGPLAWCDEIGASAVVATLDALAREYGSDRYRVATLLRRMAESGVKFHSVA
jgi:3-hydroxybutyryl-CoA dehydrogenase